MPVTSLDLVSTILDNKPAEVAANFHELMMNRIGEVIKAQKQEVAASLFGVVPKEVETPEVVQPENNDNEDVATA